MFLPSSVFRDIQQRTAVSTFPGAGMLSIAGGVLEAVSSTFAFANGITRAAGTMITSAIKSATVIKVALKISSYFPPI